MVLHIVTNGHERELLTVAEIPSDIVASEFDYLSDDDYSPRFAYAYGEWWDVFDTEYTGAALWPAHMRALADWHGYVALTYGSGVAFRMSDDHERVTVARFYVVSDWERR